MLFDMTDGLQNRRLQRKRITRETSDVISLSGFSLEIILINNQVL